jgi:pimeloyl-ACP methyl ester carboxylesterase
MRRTVAAVIATLGLLFSGLATGGPPAQGALAHSPTASLAVGSAIAWTECEDPLLRDFEAECGWVRVPLDYDDPDGRQIKLAVSRMVHTSPDSEYQGVMLTNPGGPGGSGLIFSILRDLMPNGSGASYDWIGFDPRGVGSSKPSLSCQPSYFHQNRPDYVPTSKRILRRWLERAASYADACHEARPRLLPNMTTRDSARDMNRIRAALEAERINFYGYSYGTYLGQVFATLFPERVRRMVLDSNVNPERVWYRYNLDQNIAIERVVQRWFKWIARYREVYHLGRTAYHVEQLFYRTRSALDDRPAGGQVGPSEWTDAFNPAAYNVLSWPELADVFAAWVHKRNARPVTNAWLNWDTPGNDNLFAVYNAVECTDAHWPKSWKKWADDNWTISQFAPFFTWSNAWFNASCRVWRAPSHRKVKVDGHGANALLVGETLEGATPFSGSLEVRSRFSNSRLIAIRGGLSHATTPFQSSRCTNRLIATYLKTGERPARKPGRRADVSCRPLPLPTPQEAGRAQPVHPLQQRLIRPRP